MVATGTRKIVRMRHHDNSKIIRLTGNKGNTTEVKTLPVRLVLRSSGRGWGNDENGEDRDRDGSNANKVHDPSP